MVTLRLSELQLLRTRHALRASLAGTKRRLLDRHFAVVATEDIRSGAWGSSPIEDYFEDRQLRDEQGGPGQ